MHPDNLVYRCRGVCGLLHSLAGKLQANSTSMPVAALGMGVDVDVMMSVCVAPKLPHLAG